MQKIRVGLAAAVASVLPGLALANGAMFLFMFDLRALLVATIPVILIEARIFSRRLNFSPRRGLKASLIANLLSAVVSVPFTTFEGVGFALVIDWLLSPWPYFVEKNDPGTRLALWGGYVLILAINYVFTMLVELAVIGVFARINHDGRVMTWKDLLKCSAIANGASYALLFVLTTMIFLTIGPEEQGFMSVPPFLMGE